MKGTIVDEETTEVAETEEVPATETNDAPNDTDNEASEVSSDDTPAPDSESEPGKEDASDEEDTPYQPRQYTPDPIDFSTLPADENGNVDLSAVAQVLQQRDQNLLQAAQQQMREEFTQMRQEETLWGKAEKAYPEIAKDKELRELVQQTRYGIIASGKNASPLQAAQRIFKHTQAAHAAGQTQAKESVRIQRSAALETSSVQTNPNSGTGELMDRISSRDKREAESARQELYAKWFQEGKLTN